MKKYLIAFWIYQDNLLWDNDIDDIDTRINMWLKSDECKKTLFPPQPITNQNR